LAALHLLRHPGSKHWWIDALDVDDPADFESAEPRTVFPGDEHTGVKDPIVKRTNGGWEARICCHRSTSRTRTG